MSKNEIMVSVIMPAYNCEKYIEKAMESVYQQTCKEAIELIVIDNNSKDDTLKIVKRTQKRWQGRQTEQNTLAADEKIRILTILENSIKGAATSRNVGMRHAKGTYIAFLDADDWWDETKLEKQLVLIEQDAQCVLVCAGRELMHIDGSSTGRTIPVEEKVTYQMLLKHNQINCSSVVVKTEVAKQFPMEHEDSHEDYIMWLRILQKYGYALGVNEPLLKTRLSEGGKSRNKLKSAKMNWLVYRYMGFSFPKACWCFVHYMIAGIRKYYG